MDEPSAPEVAAPAPDRELPEPRDESTEPPLEPGDDQLADAWWAL